MGDDTEFIKLPLEERCTHKLWKARLHGYTEAAKLFQDEDEKAQIFSQFAGHMSKFVADSNAAAQEKGLEAALQFVERAPLAGRTAKDVMSVIVAKCIAAPRTKTKDLSVQVALMYVEVEKHEVVVEELMKGMDHKNPKIVAACISTLTAALHAFGSRVIVIKPLMKSTGPMLEDRDKTVRDEAKALVVEMFRWIGDGIKPLLASLKPVQVTELEAEFDKVRGEKATPSRYLKSQQQQQQAKMAEKESGGGNQDEEDEVETQQNDVDPYDLMDAINILSVLPKDFYQTLDAKKWQERKEGLEALEKILEYPKFEKGDYGELVRSLMKVITKDANVVVVGIAVKCVGRLALGLKRGFQPYASSVLPQLLEKFKEKKANVVTPLRDTVDAIYPNTSLEAVQEDLVAMLDNKNPSIKAETASFLARCFARCTPANLNKKLMKVLVTALLKSLNESDPTVRDNAAEALGTAMKVVGEKGICPFMPDLDNLKMTKIKECCEKAVVVKQPVAKAAQKPPANVPKPEKPKSAAIDTRTITKGPPKKAASGTAIKKSGSGPIKHAAIAERERDLSQEEVDEKANEIFSEDILKGLTDAAWKTRLEATEAFLNTVRMTNAKESISQILTKTLVKKPGLKETNFQVLKIKLDTLKYIAETFPLSILVTELVVSDVTDKLGDPKNGSIASDVLLALAEATELDVVAKEVMDYAMSQKSPKVQSEALLWMGEAIKEFGLAVPTRYAVDLVKKGLNSTTVTVRTAAVSLAGVLYLYQGQQVATLIDEKPALMSLITAEFEKRAGEKPPTPTRGKKKMSDSAMSDELGSDVAEVEEKVEEKVPDTVTRVDLTTKISETLLAELADKNWKVRNEALLSLSNIITESKSIKANLGELPAVLNQRLVDSNGKLTVLALEICRAIATSMGSPCKTHVKTFFRNFLGALGDSKAWVRTAALSCINTWGRIAGYKEFFEGEVIPDMLKNGSPTLRTELWTLLAEILPNTKPIPKEEITLCVPHLYSSLEDRNSDVRKSAQAVVLGVMIHVGYGNMVKQTEKLKPGSKTLVMGMLEKTRPDLPVQPEPKSRMSTKKEEEKPKAEVKVNTKTKATVAVKPQTTKKQEEVDLTPLLPTNNLKHQRMIDEQKLKTLKWNFTLPRSEFVELLRELMLTAGFNKTLITNMFHADFKFHLKAIESLSEDLDNVDALVCNLDLILKWMTLRFFDTNPSVLLKGLEYLQNVFGLLIDQEYTVLDMEANSFIPYLVLKIGDPKDAVKDRVRAIFNQLSLMYNAGRLFTLVMDGLKSKNARQRTECLEELGNLIEKFGMTVCQPNPTSALKEISKQISDRDNSVRSAALNAIVKAWFIEGDKIYKMIGQISEKELSLLEERVKRASKNRSNATMMYKPEPKLEKEKSPETKTKTQSQTLSATMVRQVVDDEEEEEARDVLPPPTAHRSGPSASFVQNLFKDLDLRDPPVPKIDLIEIDDSFLDSPVRIPDYISSKLGRPVSAVSGHKEDSVADMVIKELGSPNINVAFQSASKLRVVLQGPDRALLAPFIDPIMDSLVLQLKLVNSYSFESYGLILPQTFRMLFRIIDEIFGWKVSDCPMRGSVKVGHLQLLIGELLHTLAEDKTAKFAEGGYNQWINVFVARIIEEANHTRVTCSIIKLLFDQVANPPLNPKMTDLSTKCLCKIILLLKQPESNWWNDFDLDEVLFECHLFFQSYPRYIWKDKPSAMPVKAIKTLLLTLVTAKGKDIFAHLTKVENPCATELGIYLRKLVKTQPGSVRAPQSSRLSKAMRDHLSDIFMKIAYQETAKEGLLQLYEFKKQNPQVDLSSFLAPTSKYFQDYVESGLKKIEREKGPLKHEGGGSPASQPTSGATSGAASGATSGVPAVMDDQFPNGKGLAQYYLDKLRAVQARVGVNLTDLPDFEPVGDNP